MVKVLCGQEALNLWQQGKDAWNAWVDENPEADVDFTGLNFRDYDDISFNSYKFPTGYVDFQGIDFGSNNLSFCETDFGGGNVSFKGIKISQSEISFTCAKFGDGDIDFSRVDFADTELSFNGAVFGNGKVLFSKCSFGRGSAFFQNVNFGTGQVYFCETKFGKGIIDFSNSLFGSGLLTFENSVLIKCDLIFNKAKFKECSLNFLGANFSDGGGVSFDEALLYLGDGNGVGFDGSKFTNANLIFNRAKIIAGYFSADNAAFNDCYAGFNEVEFDVENVSLMGSKFDSALFTNLVARSVDEFSFKHSVFEKSLDLSGSNFGCVIDLRHIYVKGKTDIDGVKCSLKRQRSWKSLPPVKKINDTEDIPRLRVLKEISESNKDHDRALYFHAEEMRAKRWVRRGNGASTLDFLFSLFSNYGQSIFRPFFFLALSTVFFQFVYLCLSSAKCEVWKILMFSVANSTPFVTLSKSIRGEGLKILFPPDDIPYWIYGVMGLQNALALVFMFLIVLGLRNRFRI